MNSRKILEIMPYVLGVLIVILVAVIILTGTGSKKNTKKDDPTSTVQTAEKTDTQLDESTGQVKEPADEVPNYSTEPGVTADESINSETKTDEDVPTITSEPSPQEETPTEAPTPTPTPTPTPAPTTGPVDLTYGYTFEEKSDFVDTKPGVNLRLGASTDTSVVKFLEESTRIARTGYNAEWTRLSYEGQECYIASYLIIREVESMDTVVEEPAADDPAAAAGVDTSLTTDESLLQGITYYGTGTKLICIDPGHQTTGDSSTEPNGPGSSDMKAKVSSGTQGVATGLEEYKLNLVISQKLRDELAARGYRVIMTRESNGVQISNVERAKIANTAKADAFVRIHANSAEDSSVQGIETLCQTSSNPYNGYLYDSCYKLASKVLDSLIESTGAVRRSVWKTDTMTGINWCTVPTTIVEMGFMSNADEDRLLSTDEYQNKIVQGIANGIDAFFAE